MNSASGIEAINTLAVPVVQHRFNVINLILQDLRRTDTKMRKFLTCYKIYRPKADIDQLCFPRFEGARSLIQAELKHETATIGLHKYLEWTKIWNMEPVRKHENSQKLYSITKESWKYVKELNIEKQEELNHGLAPTKSAKELKEKAKSEGLKKF